MLDGKERTGHEYESQLVPGGVLHAVWNKNQEPAEILGLTLETPPSPAP